jgi:hypothetical protein
MPDMTLTALILGRAFALLLVVGLLLGLLAAIFAGLDPAVSHQVGSWRWQPALTVRAA